jgi:hypothetical protein
MSQNMKPRTSVRGYLAAVPQGLLRPAAQMVLEAPRRKARWKPNSWFHTRETRTILIAALLLLAAGYASGCSATPARVALSEPVGELIELLDAQDIGVAHDAQERLRAVTGKKFKTQQQWHAWYDKKVDTVLEQLDEEDTTQYALLRTREYRRLIESLDGQDAEAARIARERLEAATGQRFNSKEDWEKWLKEEVDRLQAKHGPGATTEAFIEAGRYKIAEAVPVLERCMARYTGTGLTHAFLASQTLYLIGTPEAHNVLKVFLPREDYDVGQSITYMYHFNAMPQDAIDSFIRDYHLSSTSDDIKVTLTHTGKYNFKIAIDNASNNQLSIYNPHVYQGNMLLLRRPDGHFAKKEFTVVYKKGPNLKPFISLKPGERKIYNIECSVGKIKGLKKSHGWKEGHRYIVTEDYMLNTGDVGHFLSEEGEYEVYAIYSFPKRDKPYRNQPDNVVFGRWVSEPIKVKIEW